MKTPTVQKRGKEHRAQTAREAVVSNYLGLILDSRKSWRKELESACAAYPGIAWDLRFRIGMLERFGLMPSEAERIHLSQAHADERCTGRRVD